MLYAKAIGIASTKLMIQIMTMITLVVDLLIWGLSGNMIAWYLELLNVEILNILN